MPSALYMIFFQLLFQQVNMYFWNYAKNLGCAFSWTERTPSCLIFLPYLKEWKGELLLSNIFIICTMLNREIDGSLTEKQHGYLNISSLYFLPVLTNKLKMSVVLWWIRSTCCITSDKPLLYAIAMDVAFRINCQDVFTTHPIHAFFQLMKA